MDEMLAFVVSILPPSVEKVEGWRAPSSDTLSSSAFLDEPQEVLALYGDDQRVVPDVDAVLLELPDGTRQCVGQLRPIALNLNERGVAVSSATSEYLTGPQ